MYSHISIEISPTNARLGQLSQSRIGMGSVDIFVVWIGLTLTIGALKLTSQKRISCLRSPYTHILVTIDLAQRVDLRFSCDKLPFKFRFCLHRRTGLLFNIDGSIFARKLA